MLISRYICLFTIYSVMGWIYETIYCTVKGGKWENRGFLFGPVCPIYGSGAVAISVIVHLAGRQSVTLASWQIFVISVTGSAILEYGTSWTLEKLFHAVWWDYSKLPMNLHGRISLLTSLGFGCGGLLVVYKIVPVTENAVHLLTPVMIEVLALVFVFCLACDLTLTVTELHHFDRVVMSLEDNFNQNMEVLVDGAVSRTRQIRQGIVEAKNTAEENLHLLSDNARRTIRRAYSFRDKDKKRETIRNQFLSAVRKATGKEEK